VTESTPVPDPLATAPQVRAHFGGKSDMWLWRVLHGDPTFPKPIYINKRRHWRWSELRQWEEAQKQNTPPVDPGGVVAARKAHKAALGLR
jgi:predicted DNA-binding transcriptional regulator AlpA